MQPIELRRKRFLERYGSKPPTRTWDGSRLLFALIGICYLALGLYVIFHHHHFEPVLFIGAALVLVAVARAPDDILERIRYFLTGVSL